MNTHQNMAPHSSQIVTAKTLCQFLPEYYPVKTTPKNMNNIFTMTYFLYFLIFGTSKLIYFE